MRAEQFKLFRKFVVVIIGSARGSSKWKKGPSVPKDKTINLVAMSSSPSTILSESVLETEPPVKYATASHTSSIACGDLKLNHEKEKMMAGLSERVAKLGRDPQKQAYECNAYVDSRQGGGATGRNKQEIVIQRDRTLLQDLTNSQINLHDNTTLRTWKKLAREVTPQQENVSSPTSIERRPLMELDEPQPVKKRCRQTSEVIMKENYKADAGCQLRQGQ